MLLELSRNFILLELSRNFMLQGQHRNDQPMIIFLNFFLIVAGCWCTLRTLIPSCPSGQMLTLLSTQLSGFTAMLCSRSSSSAPKTIILLWWYYYYGHYLSIDGDFESVVVMSWVLLAVLFALSVNCCLSIHTTWCDVYNSLNNGLCDLSTWPWIDDAKSSLDLLSYLYLRPSNVISHARARP